MIIKRNSFADKEDIDTGVRKSLRRIDNKAIYEEYEQQNAKETQALIQAYIGDLLKKAREKFAGMGAGVMHSKIMIKVVFVIDKLLEVNDG